MSFLSTWGRPGVGILPLQHHDYDKQGWDLAMRAGTHAVRVKGRLDTGEGLGEWDLDLDTAGDVTQWMVWPKADGEGGRQTPGWAQVWPSIIAPAPKKKDPPPVPSVDQRRRPVATGDNRRAPVASTDNRFPTPTNPTVATVP